jgi:hypothetical protein
LLTGTLHARSGYIPLLACAVALANCGGSADEFGDRNFPGGVIATLSISVREGSAERHATLTCANPNKATGFLADPGARSSACVTALLNEDVADYLRTGKRPHSIGACHDVRSAPSRSVVITGRYEHDRIRRQFDGSDSCGEALWELLLPLVSAQQNPNFRPSA